MGASAPEYSGEQGRQKFLAFWQERGHPIVETIRRSIRTCFSVGDRVEQSGRPCRALGRELLKTRVTLIELTRRAKHYLGSDGGLDGAQRRLLKNYLRTCVPAYAAVMDGRHPDDAVASPAQDSVQRDSASPDGPLHGSIAFSQEDDGGYAWGIAWSFDSSAGAESEAIGQCREYGGTRCAEAGWFQEACGALAIGGGNGYGTGWGATTAEAERDALAQCRAVNDDCRIEVARCSRSEEAGGSGRTDDDMDAVVGRDPDDAPPSDNSEQACIRWRALWRVTWDGDHMQMAEDGTTKAKAEDLAREQCSFYESLNSDGSVYGCTVDEARCVQPRSHAQQPGPPGEAPDPDDASPSDNSGQACDYWAEPPWDEC